MSTIADTTDWISGMALDRDVICRIRFCPSDKGIHFVRNDLPGRPKITCGIAEAKFDRRWTSLKSNDVWVRNVEHVLAAIVGMKIDSIVIETQTESMPILGGGSCFPFCDLISKIGIVGHQTVGRLDRPIFNQFPGKRWIAAFPANKISISYIFDVIGRNEKITGFAEYCNARAFPHFADSRTYYLRSEQRTIKKILSSARKGFIVLDNDSPRATVIEATRHKILDFIGDMVAFSGRFITGRYILVRTGHKHHLEFMSSI